MLNLRALTIAFRTLWKSKTYTAINVLGLSLGLSLALLAFIYIADELSVDAFHSKADHIYRVNKIVTLDSGEQIKNAESSGLMGPLLSQTTPEIMAFVRYSPVYQNIIFQHENRIGHIESMGLIYVDSTFFDVFDFELIRGDSKTVLSAPQSVVLTQDLATQLFGIADPLGQALEYNDIQLQVSGIAKSPPSNSHIQFKALVSWSTIVPGQGQLPINWMNNARTQGICTYLLAQPNSEKKINEASAEFVQTHIADRVDRYSFYVQAFKQLYLHSGDVGGLRMAGTGNINYIYFMVVASLFLLVIAIINYINIAVARSVRRSREVGIKKAVGASRSQLVLQFLTETMSMTILSVAMAILILWMLMPQFNFLVDKSLSLSSLLDGKVILGLLGLILVITVLSGIYPAIVSAAFKPAFAIKSINPSFQRIKLRDSLVGVQLLVTFIMISGSILVFQQIRHVLSQDIGFNPDQMVVLPLSKTLRSDNQAFMNDVRSLPQTVHASSSYTSLGGGSSSDQVGTSDPAFDPVDARMYWVDVNFPETYQLKLKEGRFFSPEMTTDDRNVLINESLLNRFEWTDPIDRRITFDNESEYRVIGVVQDFYLRPLYGEGEPAVIFLDPTDAEFAAIRYTGSSQSLVEELNRIWEKHEAIENMNFFFSDSFIASQYKGESKLLRTTVIYAALTMGLSLIGLFGVLSIVLANREKELAIRKVLGIRTPALIALFTRKYVFILLLSQLIAVPIVMIYFSDWLERFQFSITVGPGIFVFSFFAVALVGMSTMIYQVLKASRKNPVVLLRNE